MKVHEGNVTTIPAARVYPALFLDQYKASVNPQMISLCESLGLEYGILFAQGFYDPCDKSFSIFEAGLRSAAECPCRFMENITGQNHIHMLVDYILTGSSDYDLNCESPNLRGKTCGIISFSSIGGKVGSIEGLKETLDELPGIIRFENRYPVGSVAPDGNTLRQLMLRFIRFDSLVWEGPLEKEMATHSSILAWEIPWTEEPGRLQSTGLQESDTN